MKQSKEINYEFLYYLKSKMAHERTRLHFQLKENYKKLFRLMDLFVILLIIFNIGALFTTNMLVYKTTPTTKIYEVNPAASQIHGFQQHPEEWQLFISFAFQMIAYLLIICAYGLIRHNIFTRTQLIISLSLIGGYALISCIDFFNDFGYLIGKVIWGS